MSHNTYRIQPIEKIIYILSYLTMGIVGLIWIIIAHINKRNLKYFLMYNISQSMIIAVILAIFKTLIDLLVPILWIIPVISYVASAINFIVSVKIIRLYFIGISFSIFELAVFLLLAYIILGVINGRISKVPLLTNIMNKAMKNYN